MTPIPHVHKRVERGQLNLQWNTFTTERTGFVRAAGLRLPTKEIFIALVEVSTSVLPRVAPRRDLGFHGPKHMFNQAHGKIGMQAFDECWLFRRDGTIEQMGGYPVPFQELCNGVAVRRDMIQVCVAFHLSCHGISGLQVQRRESGKQTAANSVVQNTKPATVASWSRQITCTCLRLLRFMLLRPLQCQGAKFEPWPNHRCHPHCLLP